MEQARQATSAFDMLGGMPVVKRIVDRFYDLLDEQPDYAELRALHAPDLAPMRDSLAGFLAAWLGGPRDWFVQHPGRCMMSAHRSVAMSPAVGRQWGDAMRMAIAETPVDPAFGAKLAEALAGLARDMAASG